MALSIAVHPLTPTLDMYGDSDSSAAYSLSGHVSISVSSPSHSLFNNCSTVRLLLQSLSVTFEGQSEVYSPCIGYSSLRLCSVTRECTQKPTELSNEGSAETCLWNVTFNLPIPGWLPPTTSQGIKDTGIRYLLYATAKFTYLDQDQMSWSFTSLCTPFLSQVKSAHGQTEIQLRRFISAPRVDTPVPKVINYLVDSHDLTSTTSIPNKPRVPAEVLNKMQLLVSVPEYANVKDSTLPLTIRLRTKDLCEEDCKRLQVTEVAVDIQQREKCRSRPPLKRLRQYPLPLKEMQPPNLPLLDPHPLSYIYDAGFFGYNAESVCRTFSILPSPSSGTYKLPENNYVFVNDAAAEEVATWYTMEAIVPFMQCSPANAEVECPEWPGSPNLLPSMSSPLYSVRHNASITLTCAFDLPSGEVAYNQLKFTVPITFANVAPILPSVRTWTPPPAHSPSSVDAAALPTSATPPPSPSHFPSDTSPDSIPVLPAYSQLYHFNGEPKIDYSTPLPLYSPGSSTEALVKASSSTSISSSSDSHLDFTMKIMTTT